MEANRALAEAYIARHLGFSVRDLRNRERPLSLPALTGVRFKRQRNEVDDRVRAAALVALRAARLVVTAVGGRLAPWSGQRTARAIRDDILRDSPYVDLDSLLHFCWRSGIVVIQLAHVPAGGKRFDGMAASIEGRPVIVLASGRDGPPWLAFHLAHELGHLMLGHVGPGSEALVDTSLEGEAGSGAREREADRFASEVLAGSAEPRLPDLKEDAAHLAATAVRSGPRRGIDPGVLVLIYARSNSRWPVAQTALKHLDLHSGGRKRIAEHLRRHLVDANLLDDDDRFLAVLSAA